MTSREIPLGNDTVDIMVLHNGISDEICVTQGGEQLFIPIKEWPDFKKAVDALLQEELEAKNTRLAHVILDLYERLEEKTRRVHELEDNRERKPATP